MNPRRGLTAGAIVALAVALAAAFGSLDGGEQDAEAAPWEYAEPMSQRRSYIAAAELEGDIYAAGGMVGETGRRLATFQRYDPGTNAWETLSRLPDAIRAATAAAVGGTFYVIGGDAEEGDGTQVYAYDLAAGRWESRAALPAPRFNHSAVAFGGKVYVLGGYIAGEERAEVFVYDPAEDAWSKTAPLPEPIHAFDAVVFRGEIWVMGGRQGDRILRSVWIYDPATGSWREGPAMPKPMELLGAAVVEDEEIHAVWESTYQIYDAASGTWREGPRSLTTRHGLNTFYVDGALFTIGGCTTQLRDSQIVETRRVV
jgi:N-acetylneuraminic acid mutarotase